MKDVKDHTNGAVIVFTKMEGKKKRKKKRGGFLAKANGFL